MTALALFISAVIIYGMYRRSREHEPRIGASDE